MAKWFELSWINGLRVAVGEFLEENHGLPPSKDKNETAAAFWERVEKAGQLIEALEVYDEYADSRAEWAHMPRETKKMFAERIEREGRQAEVEKARSGLIAGGYSLREIHEKLVCQFQPQDGRKTRPWTTPDPWEQGRLFRKKEDQEKLQVEIERGKESDWSPKSRWHHEWDQMHREKKLASSKAEWRLDCAKWRRDERVALANARRRAPEAARELKESQAAAKAEAERQAAAKADAERKAAEAKVEAERKAAEEKKQQEIRDREEAERRKKDEKNARRRELRQLRLHPEPATVANNRTVCTGENEDDWERVGMESHGDHK